MMQPDVLAATRPAHLGSRLLLLLWWLAHFSLLVYGNSTGSVEEGSLLKRIQVLSLAFVGSLYFIPAVKRLRRASGMWLFFLILYIIWGACSITWSQAPDLTVRRL